MTRQEFNRDWAVLVAALGFETAEGQDALYWRAFEDVAEEVFAAGISSLVMSPDFAEYARFRRLPTLAELREECEAKADRRVPLIRWGGEAIARGEYFRRIDAGLRPGEVEPLALHSGSGSAGHAKLLQMAKTLAHSRAMEVRKVLTPEEWEQRRASLLRQSDELLGPGEAPVEAEQVQ